MDKNTAERFTDLGAKGIAAFVFRHGILKYGLPLTLLVQLLGYFVKHGITTAGFGDLAAPMNVLLFTVTVLFEGLLFAWMVWNWGNLSDRSSRLAVTRSEFI